MGQQKPKYTPGKVIKAKVGRFEKVEFVPHALDRMKERRVTQDDVLEALRNPTIRDLPADVPRKRIAWTKSKSKILSVVYDEKPDILLVITVYWLEIKKSK